MKVFWRARVIWKKSKQEQHQPVCREAVKDVEFNAEVDKTQLEAAVNMCNRSA